MPSALILYQYFYPDEVVSSILFTQLAESLARKGWSIIALPCNRSFQGESKYPKSSTHDGVEIRRIWRPPFRQGLSLGRLLNSVWIIAAWSLAGLKYKPDILVVGTDPVLSATVALFWKLFRPKTLIAHWCFDLYPEAAVAGGVVPPGVALDTLRAVMATAYRRVDLLVDIGDCMRARLIRYETQARRVTIPTWSPIEPNAAMPMERRHREALFKSTKLGLLYSGSFGRAHSYIELLTLARLMRDVDAHFAFAISGNRAEELRGAVGDDDKNISFAPSVPQRQLGDRLAAGDIHIVTLREEWTGAVVPSKFFTALAVGRPVLFCGGEDSYIARLIRRYGLGWVCAKGHEAVIAEQLKEVCANPELLVELQKRCHMVYRREFSRERITAAFESVLRLSLGPENGP